jgi:hypothetical protein
MNKEFDKNELVMTIQNDLQGFDNYSDIENEIDKILSNIGENEDLESLDDIEEIRKLAIDKVFNSYMVYEKNIENKKNAEDELKNYRFVDVADLKCGDFVRYFNLTKFYDLKLVMGGTIMDLNYQDSGDILMFAPYGVKRIKQNIFFQKIKTDEMIRMRLLQIAKNV